MSWMRSPLAWLVGLGLSIACLSLLILFAFLVQASMPFWQAYGLSPLWSSQWYPYETLYGFLPAIVGSIWAMLIAMSFAVPCGLAAAIVSSEMMSNKGQAWAQLSMELMAGIPSVVYGLIGLWLLLPWLEDSFDLLTGHSLLAAGMILALMILPTIMLMSLDALRGVPQSQRQAAMSLGMGWTQRLYHVLLPQAWAGIRSGILLALGRALGETMAVMLVVGSLDRLPQPIYNLLEPAQTLTSRIGRELGEAAFGSIHFAALMACGLLLMLMAVGISMLAQHSRRETLS